MIKDVKIDGAMIVMTTIADAQCRVHALARAPSKIFILSNLCHSDNVLNPSSVEMIQGLIGVNFFLLVLFLKGVLSVFCHYMAMHHGKSL